MKHKFNLIEKTKIDGRKARWFDCDWNNNTGIENGCTKCRVCRYLDFLEWAGSCAPSGATIERNKKVEEYLKLKTLEDKHKFINSLTNRK